MEAKVEPASRETQKEARGTEPSGACGGIHTEERPTCVIVLGMAGSGKTTFVQVN